jgi:hypothetical protein
MAETMFTRSSFCKFVLYPGCDQVAVNRTSFLCSEDMDLAALRQQILSSNKTANEKAADLLLESMVND